MKLKLLFCQSIQKIVESHKEGLNITCIQELIDTEALPLFLIERMDNALRIVAHKILTHKAILIADHEEIIKEMEKKVDTSGIKSFLAAIEKTGLKCTEIISLIESTDLTTKSEEAQSSILPESELQSTHYVTKHITLDSQTELQKFQPVCVLEQLQLHSGDVIKTEVIQQTSLYKSNFNHQIQWDSKF